MSRGMRWDKIRKPGRKTVPSAGVRPPKEVQRITDPTMNTLRLLAEETATDLPPRKDLTEADGVELIGYLRDVKAGRR